MKRVVAVLFAAVAVCLLTQNTIEAGAKDGKIRWSHNKTGGCKWFPAIKVPEQQGDKPGIHTIKITFKANQLAEFFVIGDGDTDLDLYVFDAKGKKVEQGGKVVQDEDPPAEQGGGSDLCVVRWTPAQEEEFTIRIVNRGKVFNVATAGCN